MSNRLAVFVFLTVLSGCRVIDAPAPPDAPKITSFVADRQQLSSGETAALTWSITGATEVELTDAQGHAVKQSGDVKSGAASVAPTASTVYVLRATGKGGRATAFLQISVNEPLTDTFLLAAPATIGAGEKAQLLWQARGATRVTLTGDDGFNQTLTGGLGTVEVSPLLSTQYVLTAEAANGAPPRSSLARVEVTPKVAGFHVFAEHGAYPGEALRLSWDTRGASTVTLSERTFGQLTTISGAGVARGDFSYTLPATLPNGFTYADGFALRFTLTARGGGAVASQTVTVAVGDGPVIDELTLPTAVTAGGRFTVAWRTAGATRLRVLQAAQPVFDTQEASRVNDGSIELPSPAAQTDYTVIASNVGGLEDTRTQTLRVVPAPSVDTFTLTANVSGSGAPSVAKWTTSNATRVKLRLRDGAVLADVSAASRVANGSATLKPVTSAELVLEAYNAAGDAATMTRAVTVSGPFVTLDPELFSRGDSTQLSWTLASLGILELVGLPGAPGSEIVPVQNSGNFIDLRDTLGASDVHFDDTLDGVTRVALPRSFQLWLQGRRYETLYVGVNGFVAPSALTGANADLTAAGTPDVFAPLWGDFQLNASSRVVTAVRNRPGTNEQLFVVQWDSLERVGEPGSAYTFEAQLYESGQVVFVYGPFSGAATGVTAGLKLGGTALQYSYAGQPAVVAPDLELDFFTIGSSDGAVALMPTDATPVTFYARTASELLPARVLPRVFGAGDVDVTEAMPLPDGITGSSGQWFELRNNTAARLNLAGITVESTGSAAGFTLPEGVYLDAGAYLVVGQSRDTLANGGAPVDVEYGFDVQLAVPGGVEVKAGGTTLGSLSWDVTSALQSKSVIANVLPAGVLYAPGYTPPSCPRTETYGSLGMLGTPGRANDGSCGTGYAYSVIPGGFISAPASATLTFSSNDQGTASVTLPQPFTYWGTSFTTLGISTNGLIGFPSLSTSYDSNLTTASTTAPNGVVAPFWDDLDGDASSSHIAAWHNGDRYIVSWEHWNPYSDVADLNFQAHFVYASGVIEFHYGAMSDTDEPARGTGSSATIWLEKPDGNVVVPFSINTSTSLTPDMGLRFTPR